jgi:hypothetical protein
LAQLIPRDPRYHFESQVRECYGRCAYTHKTHEKMAERFAGYQSSLKWVNIVLSALITGGAVGALFDANSPFAQYSGFASYATAVLAIFSLIFNSCLKEFDPGALAQRHRETASNIWNIRESYLSLITDTLDENFSLEALRDRRDGLQEKLNEIYGTAPFTDGAAYGKAQDRIKNKEDLTFSEEELDKMLPQTLRRAGREASKTPK